MPAAADSSQLVDSSVRDVLAAHSGAASALISLRLGCVGCRLAAFHTLRDVAHIYQLSTEMLLEKVTTSHSASLPHQPSSQVPDQGEDS